MNKVQHVKWCMKQKKLTSEISCPTDSCLAQLTDGSRRGNWVRHVKHVTLQQNWWNKKLVIWNQSTIVASREKLLEIPDTIRGSTLLMQNLVLWKINGKLQFVSKSSCVFWSFLHQTQCEWNERNTRESAHLYLLELLDPMCCPPWVSFSRSEPLHTHSSTLIRYTSPLSHTNPPSHKHSSAK